MMGVNRKCTEQDIAEELVLDTDNDTHSTEVTDMFLLTYTTPSGLTVCNVDLLYRFTPSGYDKTMHSTLLMTLPHSTFSHATSLIICIQWWKRYTDIITSTSTHWIKEKPYCLI
jgi:hypothetical protein